MSTIFDILIIDDTRSIHQDIRKTLCPVSSVDEKLDSLKEDLFGEEEEEFSRSWVEKDSEYRINSAYQGEDGLGMVKAANIYGSPYAVAIVDMRMPPGWDGLKTIEKIWEIDDYIQIIICTAYSDYSWKEIQSRLGKSDRLLILKKPFEPIELHRMVSTLCKKWQSEHEVRSHLNDLDQRVQQRTEELRVAYQSLQKEIKEREAVEIQLRHAQKMEAVGQLAAGIAHEISTPIQFINDNLYFMQGFVDDYTNLINTYRKVFDEATSGFPEELALMESELDLPYLQSQAPIALTQALDGISHISKIVSSMRRYSHRSADSPTPLSVNSILEQSLTICHHAYKYVADIQRDFGDVPDIAGFETELGQVLINLIVNAAHAIEDAGRSDEEKGVICISTGTTNKGVVVSIKDSGVGIPVDIQNRIFEPFFTTKPVGRGTGQGLAIAYSIIVDKHGGEIELDSVPSHGTTFRLHLPLAAH